MLEVLFRLDLQRGSCVAVRIPSAVDDQLADLPAAERAIAESLPPARRASWVAGRAALRAAALDVGHVLPAIGITDRGGPALPDDLAGSISHKRDIAIALAL